MFNDYAIRSGECPRGLAKGLLVSLNPPITFCMAEILSVRSLHSPLITNEDRFLIAKDSKSTSFFLVSCFFLASISF
jgi:hypothetical protein